MLAPSRSTALAGLLLSLSLATAVRRTPGCAFVPPAVTPAHDLGRACLGVAPRGDTALSMGIRSFVRRKVFRKEAPPSGTAGDDATSRAPQQSAGTGGRGEDPAASSGNFSLLGGDGGPTTARTKARKRRGTSDGAAKPDSADRALFEETQARIQRMKGGGMTAEEKAAFLNNALSSGLPKQKPRGPPIRQRVPGVDGVGTGDGASGGGGGGGGGRGKARRGDTVERGLQRGRGPTADISVASLMMDGKMKNEEAKRRYMDSITNPARFASFSTYQPPPGTAEAETEAETEAAAVDDEEGAIGVGGEQQEAPEADQADEGPAAEEGSIEETALVEGLAAPSTTEASGAVEVTDFVQMRRQIAADRALLDQRRPPEQSAARDAVESILSMIGSNSNSKGDEPPRAVAADLGARLEQAAAVQETREARERRAAEKEAARVAAEAQRARVRAQEARDEELRRQEAERAEKARRLDEEERRREEARVAREREEMAERQARQDEYWAKMLNKERSRSEQRKDLPTSTAVAPDVPEKQTREEEQAGTNSQQDEIKAKVEPTRSSATVSSLRENVSPFVREQRQKNKEIARLRARDAQTLQSLNSPLPSPGRKTPAPAPAPALHRAPARPPARAAPAVSLASLTMAKKDDGSTVAAASPNYDDAPTPAPQLNLFEMTKLKQGGAPAAAPPRRGTTRQGSAKRVVRQSLPLTTGSVLAGQDDDEDDEGDDLMRSGAPGLTVADALKQQRKSGGGSTMASGANANLSADDKAKQWGIDMSKFK